MARVLYLNDGTKEIILSGTLEGQIIEMARIIRERLGDDAEKQYLAIVDASKTDVTTLEQELKSYEGTCESYYDCLLNVLCGLNGVTMLLRAPHIDRRTISEEIRELVIAINNEI